MKDFEYRLKNIKIPQFKNKTYLKSLEVKFKQELHKRRIENNKKIKSPVNFYFRYSFTLLFIIIFLSTFIILIRPKQLEFSLNNKNGNVFIKPNNKSDFIKMDRIFKLDKNQLIKTDINSQISFKLGSSYNINL